MTTQKFCVNCKHFRDGRLSRWCDSPNQEVDVVTGKHKPLFANVSRGDSQFCGVDGRWFEQAETQSLGSRLKNFIKSRLT